MEQKYIDRVGKEHPHLFEPVKTEQQIAAMTKEEIIADICTFHPGYGTDKGFSWYVGGMADTGEWLPRKMKFFHENDLRSFLQELYKDKNLGNKRHIEELAEYYRRQDLPQEERDELYREDRRRENQILVDLTKDFENKLMWGKGGKL